MPTLLLLFLFAGIRIDDSVDAFARFWEAAKSAPAPERVKRFRETVWAANPDFYAFRFEDWKSSGRVPDEELLKQVELFNSYADGFSALHRRVREELDASLASFAARFPDFKTDFPVYVVHSLGLADGTKRTIGGREVFVVGLDLIARYHPDNNIPFFHHELLHFYHAQHYRQTSSLYSHLWGEGLAVYASEALNPGASARDILLSDGRVNFADRVDPVLNRIAAGLLAQLDSEDWQVHLKYFASSAREPSIPARTGYYVGYLLAKRLAARYTLEEMVRLQDAALRPALAAELQRMAGGKQ